MHNVMKQIIYFFTIMLLSGCMPVSKEDKALSEKIKNNQEFEIVKEKARDLIRGGFSAGENYGELWIRDFNTFMNLACEVYDKNEIRKKLIVFFQLQGDDGNIVDGYIAKDKTTPGGYDYIYSDLNPEVAGHKNNVETDQESSLIQGVYKYIKKTGDTDLLKTRIGDHTIAERLEMALNYLMNHRFNRKYGLIYGATTADWGDVQPEHKWGVFITDSTHYAIDIYDNAMLVIALKNFMELVPEASKKWEPVLKDLEANIRKYLWDAENMKFHPHIYLNGSPFPPGFDEDKIYYHGGTAVAIEAGLLNRKEIKISLDKMIENVKAAGAASIGLTLYPAYPLGYFKNPILTVPYTYQNGGDWTWFGGRMIQQLVKNGFVKEAYEQVLPFTERVVKNSGFYEWYTLNNEPRGSSSYRGSAGVLYDAIILLENWAADNN